MVRRIGMKLVALAVLCGLMLGAVPSACAIKQTLMYFSAASGTQNTESVAPGIGKGESYLSTIANRNGVMSGSRQVKPLQVRFDFYRIMNGWAAGFGIGMSTYANKLTFADGSKVSISSRAIYYGLTYHLRRGGIYPYFGFGTGSHYAHVTESVKINNVWYSSSFFEQASSPLYYNLGVRIPFGSWGVLLTQQAISAPLRTPTEEKDFELGGVSRLLGLYWGF